MHSGGADLVFALSSNELSTGEHKVCPYRGVSVRANWHADECTHDGPAVDNKLGSGVNLSVCVVMPTYNEAANLPAIVQKVFSLNIPDLFILIVDDNSPDNTGAIADALAAGYPSRLYVLHRPAKQGLGTAYVAGFAWALEHGADVIVQMDADFSHSPDYLPIMLDKIREYDVVVGSRYVPGGRVDDDWPVWRRFLSWWGSRVYARTILGLKVHDATSGFKCLRREVLERIGLPQVRSNGYVFQVEIAYLCEKNGFRVLEIPIYFEDRARGKSKMSIKVNAEAAWRVWQMRWRYRDLKPVPEAARPTGQQYSPRL